MAVFPDDTPLSYMIETIKKENRGERELVRNTMCAGLILLHNLVPEDREQQTELWTGSGFNARAIKVQGYSGDFFSKMCPVVAKFCLLETPVWDEFRAYERVCLC